ncbi:MAG: enoyl-CoA hydratase/isomerase family protein [Vulcanimicrobiaceae bacterium]
MIRLEHPEPGIALVTVDRQQARNAMTFAMWEQLGAYAAELDADDALRCVVIAGAGEAAFVSGTDIGAFAAFTSGDDGIAYEARVEAVIAALARLRVPAIAAIRGACTGGGASIAGTCDVRIGGPGTRIGIPIARTLGNAISLRNVARLAALVGLDAARALLLTGTLLGASDAYRLGFLSELVASDDAILPRALEAARAIAALAPLTVRASKAMAARLLEAQHLPADADLLRACYGSDDFREGVAAFVARRPPRWTGR